MRALVTGATGFVGRRLLEQLDDVVVLSRDGDSARRKLQGKAARLEAFSWDAQREPPPSAALDGVDVVLHLAGESVGEGRWTADKKRRIRDSRVLGTRHLVQGIAAAPHKPRVLVSASAVGIYGDRGEEELTEQSPPGGDFLASVCQEWEQQAQAAQQHGVRVVNPRLGIVLGPGGGALGKMLTPFRLGVGGRLGSGRQWMPWVHLDDVIGILLHALERDDVQGPINAVAPEPVTNRQFTKVLARVLHRPAVFPAPAFALKLGLGQFADVLLGSQRVLPAEALRSGYQFKHTDLEAALRTCV